MSQKDSSEKAVRDIRRKTRRKFSAEEKIRIVLEALRGEGRGRGDGFAPAHRYHMTSESPGKSCHFSSSDTSERFGHRAVT